MLKIYVGVLWMNVLNLISKDGNPKHHFIFSKMIFIINVIIFHQIFMIEWIF